MTEQDLVDVLVKEHKFYPTTARAYLEAEGRCTYCNEDLYSERVRYHSQQIDHIFPKAIFKELEWEQLNLVLSCFKCNNLKRSNVFLGENEDPLSALKNRRSQIIAQIREELKPRIVEEEKNCQKLQSLWPWLR